MESKEERIEFAKRNKWFLEGVKEKLFNLGWRRDSDENATVVLVTDEYDYNYQTLKLVQKRLSTKEWKCIMRSYSRQEGYSVVKGDIWYNHYTFWMEKKKDK